MKLEIKATPDERTGKIGTQVAFELIDEWIRERFDVKSAIHLEHDQIGLKYSLVPKKDWRKKQLIEKIKTKLNDVIIEIGETYGLKIKNENALKEINKILDENMEIKD